MANKIITVSNEGAGRARQVREVFYGKPVSQETELPFGWPEFVRKVGKTNAQIYWSDKMLNGGRPEMYKHIAEGPQVCFVNPENTVLCDDDGTPIVLADEPLPDEIPHLVAPAYVLEQPMPKHVAVLAQNKGIQIETDPDVFFEVRMPKSTLAAAVHPKNNRTFLLIYSKEGVHFIITGSQLRIGREGIAG